jgi:Protein of unknown function (DUF3568)
MTKRWLVGIVYLLLAAIVLANSGCLGLIIGGAAGGAAAGYVFYERGEWYRDYPTNLEGAALAVTAALNELQLPVVKDKRKDDEIIIDSRTTDDARIRIRLTPVASRIPADPATTHISIRVGALGDETLSTRLHEQISLHLVAPIQVRQTPVPAAPVPVPSNSTTTPPVETTQPPLATPTAH